MNWVQGERRSIPYFINPKLNYVIQGPKKKFAPVTGFDLLSKTGCERCTMGNACTMNAMHHVNAMHHENAMHHQCNGCVLKLMPSHQQCLRCPQKRPGKGEVEWFRCPQQSVTSLLCTEVAKGGIHQRIRSGGLQQHRHHRVSASFCPVDDTQRAPPPCIAAHCALPVTLLQGLSKNTMLSIPHPFHTCAANLQHITRSSHSGFSSLLFFVTPVSTAHCP